ncbi:MAG TPA: hypothetical protein VFA86_10060 [Gammaproteobacteria bacterium]|nr:hypothetical protein [Gammaproteobacteria bacterium]
METVDLEQAITHSLDTTAGQLATTTNERHRQILHNYMMHVHLEGAGEFEKIVAPDMMVDDPEYRILWGTPIIVRGKEEVLNFYNSIGQAILWHTDEMIAVADWGFASEVTFHQVAPAAELAPLGVEVDDGNGWYHLQSRQVMVWPYDERGRLGGERIYEDVSTRQVARVDEGSLMPAARVKELRHALYEKVRRSA